MQVIKPQLVLGMAHNSAPEGRSLLPQAFAKSVHTVVGAGCPIFAPPDRGQLYVETELVLVVGKRCSYITAEQAEEYVAGWTVGNDVTLPEQSAIDSFSTQSKNGVGFTPLLDQIVSDIDVSDLRIETLLDGQLVASCSTADLAWNPYECLAYLSQHVCFEAGDIILTGAPASSAPAHEGQEVTARIIGIGEVTNPIVSGQATTWVPQLA